MNTSDQIRQPPRWTHAMRVEFDYMAPAYERGEWMFVSRGRAPRKHSRWVFANDQPGGRRFVVGRVEGWDATHWYLRQYNPKRVRRVSRAKWRPFFHVLGNTCGASPYYEALSAGDMARVEAVVRANDGVSPMPPPLPPGTPRAGIVKELWPGR